MTKGVYFSANDVVYPWAVGFLNSFRTYNKELKLVLIPFNEDSVKLRKMACKYDFDIYECHESFSRLENIGNDFELGYCTMGKYWFRRYASFWGPLDQFIYLDARMLVLRDLSFYIDALDKYKLDLLHYDTVLNQVYEDGSLKEEFLKNRYARGFLSGIWASRKGLFNIGKFESLAKQALMSRAQMNERNTDQAFFNFCCDRERIHYGHIAEYYGNMVTSGWAGQPGTPYLADDWRMWHYGGLDHKKQLVLLHWAGYPLKPWVPHYFLLKRYGVVSKWSGVWTGVLQKIFQKIKSNRLINTIWHRFIK